MSSEGETYGYTVYETYQEHPKLLGPDGKPLIIINKKEPIGFKLGKRKGALHE